MPNEYSPLYEVPKGVIVLWSGAVGDIPFGWALCDGNNDTPDLRNRFVVGAGGTYNPGDIGGAEAHSHGISQPTAQESEAGTSCQAGLLIAAKYQHTHMVSGSTNPADTRPPYYALCFIMKT